MKGTKNEGPPKVNFFGRRKPDGRKAAGTHEWEGPSASFSGVLENTGCKREEKRDTPVRAWKIWKRNRQTWARSPYQKKEEPKWRVGCSGKEGIRADISTTLEKKKRELGNERGHEEPKCRVRHSGRSFLTGSGPR